MRMKTTRDPHKRPGPSRRAHRKPPIKGHRYVVTTVDVVPDDLIEIVSRAHAAALAMTHLDPGTSGRAPENAPKEDASDEEEES